MIDKATPEALSLADSVAEEWATGGISSETIEAVGEKLRRQHARIAELEAEIAAVGTGGVQALSAAPAVPTNVKGAMWFTKKPVTIQAIQWTGKNLREVITFTDGPPDTRSHHAGMAWDDYRDLVARDGLKIYTLEGKMLASPGDWIIRGVKGELYPCKPDIFQATYAAASTTPPAEQPHPDDTAVDRFAEALKAKLAAARAKGRGGWDTPECTQQRLSDMLREHVAKGDPRDVANFCLFLWARGESIAPPAEQQAITPETGNSVSAQGAAITSESGAVYADLPERTSTEINDACWAFVEAMPHNLPGPIWNDLKPAVYAAICKFLQAVPKAAPGDALDEALRERDDAEDFIDATLDEVLGHERPEWSSSYGRADALNDVQERMTALHKPAVDKAWDQFQSTKAAPKGAAEPAAIVKWQLGGSLVAHLVGDVAEGDLLYKGAPPQPLVREPANWEQLRSALAMAMQGWGSRTDRTAETLNTVLDAITEPDMPLAVLRSAPDWRKWRDAAPLNQRTGPITDNPKPGDKYWDVSGGMAREQTWQGLSPEWDLLDAGALHWDEVSATAALDAAAPQPSPTAQVAAPQQEAVEIPAAIEQMATGRYKVVPSHESMFHRWAVVAGTGTQQLYAGREVECQNMARKFAGAFLDGAFVAMQRTAPNAPAPLSEILDNAEIYKIWFESNSAWHQMIGPKPDRNNHFARAVEAEVLRRAALAAQRGK